MSIVQRELKYHCSDDCRQSGCPGHKATIEFQSVTNSYIFDNGRDGQYFLPQEDMEALIGLMKKLQDRADVVKV